MDITVSRLRQITAVIRDRTDFEQKLSVAKIEWQTKALSTFIAATAFTDEDGHRELMEAAANLSMTPKKLEAASKEPDRGSFEKMGLILGGSWRG